MNDRIVYGNDGGYYMIKITDILGSLIVLSSYLFVMSPPRDPAAIFVVVPFLFGIALSMVGLASHDGKKWVRIYIAVVAGMFVLTFIFMLLHVLAAFTIFHAAPVLIASSSLIMAHLAKNDELKFSERKGAPL